MPSAGSFHRAGRQTRSTIRRAGPRRVGSAAAGAGRWHPGRRRRSPRQAFHMRTNGSGLRLQAAGHAADRKNRWKINQLELGLWTRWGRAPGSPCRKPAGTAGVRTLRRFVRALLYKVMFNSLDIAGRPQDTRAVVAMSGGVDSSVTAALLKDEGYDVVGVTLQLYDHGAATHRKGACCAGQDIYDARMVADRIGIPHYVLDYETRFKEAVIDRFADSYVAGETPVPCVDCNQAIKFYDLLATAQDLGARVLATGHYVASRALPDGSRALPPRRRAGPRQRLLPFPPHAGATGGRAFSARRDDQGRDPRARASFRFAGRREARQPGHLLRPLRTLHRRDRALAPRRRGARRHRRSRRPRARPPRWHHPFHGRAAARARHRGRRAALRGAARRGDTPRRGRL